MGLPLARVVGCGLWRLWCDVFAVTVEDAVDGSSVHSVVSLLYSISCISTLFGFFVCSITSHVALCFIALLCVLSFSSPLIFIQVALPSFLSVFLLFLGLLSL